MRSASIPNNTLFWHRQRQRLEGEAIRDAILAVSGTLDETMFGPGTLDQAMKRRSIYFQIKRSQFPPMLTAFDAPDTLQSMGLRPSTTVAPQSLLLMNNPQIRAAARAWAARLGMTKSECSRACDQFGTADLQRRWRDESPQAYLRGAWAANLSKDEAADVHGIHHGTGEGLRAMPERRTSDELALTGLLPDRSLASMNLCMSRTRDDDVLLIAR